MWLLPDTPVAWFQATWLLAAVQVPLATVSALLVYPAACVVLVGRLSAVIVTGYGFGFEMVIRTSPVLPG